MERLRTQRPQHTRFYVLLVLLLVLISVRYALQIDIPRFVFLLIIGLIAVFGDKNEITAMCMCCIPLHESVDFFYSVVICMAAFVFKYHRHIRVNLTIIPFLFFFIWELLHCFVVDLSLIEYLSSVIPLMALMIFMNTDPSDLDYGFIVRVLAAATAANCLMLLGKVLYRADFHIAAAFMGLQRLGMAAKDEDAISGAVNPNTLGIICVLASTGLMQLRSVGRGKNSDVFLTCLLLVFGTLTASRTYLVCLLLMVVLLLFSQKGSFRQKLRFLLTIVFVLLLGLAVLYVLFPELMEYFIGRFFVADITTGRLSTMALYHEFIVSNPDVMFFGIGLQDFGDRLLDLYRIAPFVPHNGIQEIIIAWGLPGLAVIGILLIMMALRSEKYSGKHVLLRYIPLLIILAKTMAGQIITSGYTMLALSYAYLSLCADLTPKGEDSTPG